MRGRHPLLWRIGGLVVLTGVLCGCNSSPPGAETPPPAVTVSQPLVREVVDYDDYEGRIDAFETVEVRARVRGYLVKVNFEAGQMVEAGDLLFEIDPKPYQVTLEGAEAVKVAADASLKYARAEYNRVRALGSKRAASSEEVEVWAAKQVVAQGEVAKAQAAVDQAKLDLGFTRITSRITGKTSRPQVTVGNLVNAGGGETLLTTVTSVDPMYVYFDVDERALLRYRQHVRGRPKEDLPVRRASTVGLMGLTPGAGPFLAASALFSGQIPVNVGLDGEEGYPRAGVVDFADNRVNPGTGTIQVRGVLPNPGGILDAGMRARVRVPVGGPHEAVMVTERAIGTDQGRKFVYVVNDQNVAERRDVKLGRLRGRLQVIQEGVEPGDWIIVNGIQRVRDGAKVEPKRTSMPGAAPEQTNQASKN
jgi:multidrug efflux system membrane fusion protein